MGEWGILNNSLHSALLRQGKYSILSNKDIYIYFNMLCIPGNNQNKCKHYSFEAACQKRVMGSIELRCILFPLIILEMLLQLDWSPPVLNYIIDWT
jgi:hypothetical protein